MHLSSEVLDRAMVVALQAAHAAGKLIDECIETRADLSIDTKSSSADMVTQYDKRCEEIVLAMLSDFDPSWHVLSEEGHSDTPLTDHPIWVVDPIDGTTAFVHGSFDCGVSIGLAVNRVPVLGVVHLPRMKETFTAIKGRGAFLNGKRIAVSKVTDLSKAVISTHTPYKRTPQVISALQGINGALMQRNVHAIRSYGSAAMDMCSVACGRVDLYFESGICAWDVCAGTVIVREAGGVVHNLGKVDLLHMDILARNLSCGSCEALTAVGVELDAQFRYHEAMFDGPGAASSPTAGAPASQ